MTESAPIHQLYCTHCTYGTSYLHQRDGEVKNQAFEYSSRAGSVAREHSHDYFRRFESYLYYHQPADTPPDQLLKHTAFDSPARMMFFPEIGDKQALMQVTYRQTDTQGRPGSYFAHLLVAEATQQPRVLNAADCLKTWGSPNWVVQDDPDFPFELPSYQSVNEFRGSGPFISDRQLVSFLTADPANGQAFNDPGDVITERWNSTSPEERRELMVDVLQSFIELDMHKRQTLLLGAEPSVAALLFYGVARMLPQTGIGQQISFSTFESQFDRPQTALAATCTREAGKLDLGREANSPRGCTINTFLASSDRPALRWKSAPNPPTYAKSLVDMLVADGFQDVRKLIKRLENVGDLQGHELDEALRAELLIERLVDPSADAKADDVDALTSDTVKKYVRHSVGKILATQTQKSARSKKSGPESDGAGVSETSIDEQSHVSAGAIPPRDSAEEFRSSQDDLGAGAIPPPDGLLPPPPPPPAMKAPEPPPETEEQHEEPSKLKSLVSLVQSHRTWGVEVLKVIGATANVSDAVKNSDFVRKLADAVLTREADPTSGASKTPYTELVASPKMAFPHRLTMLIAYCDRFSGHLPPDQAATIWARKDKRSRENDPALLDALFRELDDDTLTELVKDQLDTLPATGAAERLLPILQSVIPASEGDVGKQGLLVELVNHEKVSADVLFSALRADTNELSQTFFKLYPTDLPPLKEYLRELLGNLPGDPEFPKSLTILGIAKSILDTADQEFIDCWDRIRQLTMTIKSLVPKADSMFSRTKPEEMLKELNIVGSQLAEAASRILIDEYYPDDIGDGRQRAEMLAEIGLRVPGDGGLPAKVVDSLESHFSGRGWKEISGRIAPVKSKSGGSSALPKIAIAAGLILAIGVGWFAFSGSEPTVLMQLQQLDGQERATRFETTSDEEFEALLADEQVSDVNKLLAGFAKSLSEEQWNGMNRERRDAILARLPAKETADILTTLNRGHRSIHVVGMPVRNYLKLTKFADNDLLAKLVEGLTGPQVQKRLESLESGDQLRLLAVLSDQQYANIDADQLDELNRATLNQFVLAMTRAQLHEVALDFDKGHVGKLGPDELNSVLGCENAKVISHVIAFMKPTQQAAITTEHLSVLTADEAQALFDKLDEESRKEIEPKWKRRPASLAQMDDVKLASLQKADLAKYNVGELRKVLGKLSPDQLVVLSREQWNQFTAADVKSAVAMLDETHFGLVVPALDPQHVVFAALAASPQQLAKIDKPQLNMLPNDKLLELGNALGEKVRPLFERIDRQKLKGLSDDNKKSLLAKLKPAADSPLNVDLTVAATPVTPPPPKAAGNVKPTFEKSAAGLQIAYVELPKYPTTSGEERDASLQIDLPDGGYHTLKLHGMADFVKVIGSKHRITISHQMFDSKLSVKASHVQSDGSRDEAFCEFLAGNEKYVRFRWARVSNPAIEHVVEALRFCVLELKKPNGNARFIALTFLPVKIEPMQLDINGKAELPKLQVAPGDLEAPLVFPAGRLDLGPEEVFNFNGPTDQNWCDVTGLYEPFMLEYSNIHIESRKRVADNVSVTEVAWEVRPKDDPEVPQMIKDIDAKIERITELDRIGRSSKRTLKTANDLARELGIGERTQQTANAAWSRTLKTVAAARKRELQTDRRILENSTKKAALDLKGRRPFVSGSIYRLVGAETEALGKFKGGVAVRAFDIPDPPPRPVEKKDDPKPDDPAPKDAPTDSTPPTN